MKKSRFLASLLSGVLTASTLLAASLLPVAASDTPQDPPASYVTVAQPITSIVGDIALIREINSRAEMDAMISAERTPATSLYRMNPLCEALDADARPFATIAEILAAHDNRILPAFRVEDEATATALIAYLDHVRFYDCMLVSSDPALMKLLRDALPSAFGVIDYTAVYQNESSLTAEQCLYLRRSMKTYGGNVALLPAHLCTRDTVQYLYEHQVNVWMQIADAPTEAEQYNALLSGAVGVISDATESLLDIACHQLAPDTLTRAPLNVGHRGIPTLAPECTVEGSLLAYEQSANVVEMDVFLTADGYVAAMHDITTGDTCNRDLHMEDCTLAELKELYVNRGWETHAKYSQLRIPTLNEYLEAFQNTDCMLFIEIKSHKEEIVPIIRDMVNEYDMYDQCAVITFNTDTMEYMRKHWPEMALGVLCEDYYNFMTGSIPEEDLRTVMEFAGPHNGTVNPGEGAYDKADVRAFQLRGISVNPWTFYGTQEYKEHFLYGYASLTGNDANVIKRYTRTVSYVPDSTELEIGDSLDLTVSMTTYGRDTLRKEPSSVFVLEGEDLVSITDGTLTVTGEKGEVTLVLGYKDRTLGYTIYTQPITLHVGREEETTLPATDAEETPPPATDTTAPVVTGSGCVSVMSSTALLLSLAATTAAVMGRKREDE